MSYWRLFYHIILSTKDRRALIDPAWEKDLYSYLGAKAQALECTPHAINGTATHLHLVLSIPPRIAIAGVIGKLKNASSRRLNGEHPACGFAWQTDYAIFTVSEAGLERIVGYVKAQKQHHAQGTLIAGFEQTSE
jgi:REP element-mobilizing transposase RayT